MDRPETPEEKRLFDFSKLTGRIFILPNGVTEIVEIPLNDDDPFNVMLD